MIRAPCDADLETSNFPTVEFVTIYTFPCGSYSRLDVENAESLA